jgi:hypothetical protein
MARDRAMRAVTFLIEHGCKALEYRGMFEDVGSAAAKSMRNTVDVPRK